ncbi:hypothetical protein [Saccharopolyspora spinosa]|uniref:hypothetical protein n=1 Tax=Saccharopolyspora spinosa TaxID=60894 RepID=UPI00376F22C0
MDGLYAAADEVLGALKESQPFRDVMAHELMTNPSNPQGDQQSQELRSKLVRYLAGDLSSGADPSTADNLLSGSAPQEPGNERSKERQVKWRRMAVGKALSGLPDDHAVERMLQNAAREDALREDSDAPDWGDQFNRSREWVRDVLRDVKRQLTSDLKDSVESLRQIMAEAGPETGTNLWNEYESKIKQWLDIKPQLHVKTIRRRAEEAAAAAREVRERRRNNAMWEMWKIFEAADDGLGQLEALHGRDHVGRAFAYVDLHFGGMQDDQSRKAVAHRLLTNGGQIWDAQAFLERLHHLKVAASAVIAGAGPEPGRDLLSESAEDVSSDAETDDTESVFDEAERAELLERLDRLRGDAEPSESHRSSGLREFGGRSARSDEEFLAGDSLESMESSSDSDVSESWLDLGDSRGSVSSLKSSVADVRGEIDRAREVGWSGDDELAARRIVQGTHDIRRLARGDAAVSLEDVVALVAAKHHELGDDHQDQVVEFSQSLAESLGTEGTGLTIHAGAEEKSLDERLAVVEASVEQLIAQKAQKAEKAQKAQKEERESRVARLRGRWSSFRLGRRRWGLRGSGFTRMRCRRRRQVCGRSSAGAAGGPGCVVGDAGRSAEGVGGAAGAYRGGAGGVGCSGEAGCGIVCCRDACGGYGGFGR